MTEQEKYYSQYRQDKIVLDILNHKRSGFFVDIGAHDGKELSNTYFMEKELDWSGICIEPNPSVTEELKKNRNCIVDTRPISRTTGEDVFFYPHDEPMLSMTTWNGVSLMSPQGEVISRNVSTKMSGVSLKDLLVTNGAPKEIDYISMDIEGCEAEILHTFDFETFDVKCWSIEWKSHGDSQDVYNNKFFIIEKLLTNSYSIKQIEADIIAWR